MRQRTIILLTLSLLATTAFAPAAAAVATDTTDRQRDAAELDRVQPEPPRIRCHGALAFNGTPRVRCRWTEAEHSAAAGYRIVRAHGDVREVVHETRDLSATRFVDRKVRFDTRYRYRVLVVNEHGRSIQASRWNGAGIAKPDVERLHLACKATDILPDIARAVVEATEDDAVQPEPAPKPVTCEWEPAESEAAVKYELWRLLRGRHREHVATVGLDRLSHTDQVPADAAKVLYAVLAVDDEGHIVGRSNVARVGWPAD